MKKSIRTSLLAALLSALMLPAGAFASPMVELAPDSKQSGNGFQELRQVETILKAVSRLRALPVLRPIQVGLLDRKQLQTKLTEQIQAEIPPGKLRGEGALYQQLGMLPPGFDYAQFLLDLYTEQIGGFYDPATRELKLIKGSSLTGLDQQLLISHELTHALQDQRYELKQFMNPKSDNDDRSLAVMALIEGDATVSSSEYIQAQTSQKGFQGLLEVLGSAFNAARQIPGYEKFRSAPAFIRDSLTFPYDQGSQFVNAFRQQGWSWSDLDTVFRHPPQSTEQILHPNAYLNGEPPVDFQFSLQPLLSGSKQLTGSVWGELGYRQYLTQHLDWQVAKAAASGWGGDRYEVLETPAGLVFGLYSVWDSETEAQEFFQAWRQSLAKRSPGTTLSAEGLARQGERRIWAERNGKGVIVVENLTADQAKLLPVLRSAWKQTLAKLPAHLPAVPIRRGMR